MTSPDMTRDDYYKNIIKNYKNDKASIQKTIEILEVNIAEIDDKIAQAETEWEQEMHNSK